MRLLWLMNLAGGTMVAVLAAQSGAPRHIDGQERRLRLADVPPRPRRHGVFAADADRRQERREPHGSLDLSACNPARLRPPAGGAVRPV